MKTQNTWGGARPGAGRKPAAEKRKPYSFRLTKKEHKMVKGFIKKIKGDNKMKNWRIVKIKDGLALYQQGDVKIKIEDADTTGCYTLRKYENGEMIGKAFWHSEDMNIPEEVEDIWTDYFGKPEFLTALDWVDWIGWIGKNEKKLSHEDMMKKTWDFIKDVGITEDKEAYQENNNLILVDNLYTVRDAYYEDLDKGLELDEDVYQFLDRHGIEWK